jgi:prepilin-type N-terminal cleavage/methylation domain-containing protein
MKSASHIRGFSLVELSIVLVILGLLVGGILAGQSLIRAAQLRSWPTETARYITATQSFRDKYFFLPGDINNATSFWGSAGGNGGDATCSGTVGTGTQTCNGDGNGQINAIGSNSVAEQFRAWQHLANAALIEGTYCGARGTLCGGASGFVAGLNAPATKLGSFYWRLIYSDAAAGTTTSFATPGGNRLFMQGQGANTATSGSGPLTPGEAWNIDTKMDDGLPGAGKMMVSKGNGTNTRCTTGDNIAPPGDAGAVYLLSNASKDCISPMLYF